MCSIDSDDNDSDEAGYIDIKTIDSISDFGEGLGILEERDLLFDYVDDLDDIKELLKLKYHKYKSMEYETTTDSNRLYDNYTKIIKEVNEIAKKVHSFIFKVTTQNNFMEVFKVSEEGINKKMVALEELTMKDQFPILTAGEAKAGKSTFVNMLLGCDILPVNVITCTTFIWEIKKSDKKKITFHMEDGVRSSCLVGVDEKDILEKTKDFQDYRNCKKAVLEYPVEFLNDITFLVDSPGIGDTQELEKVAFNYLDKHTCAFIFVLNATNSDGLHIRARKLILKARDQITSQIGTWSTADEEQIKKDQMRRAVFILNHWDVVKMNSIGPSEVEEVKLKIIKEIKMIWDESAAENVNIFFMSARQAKEWASNGYEMIELKKVKTCLKELASKLYRSNLDMIFRNLRDVLRKMESVVLNCINTNVDFKYDLLFDRNRTEELCKMLEKVIDTIDQRQKSICDQLKPRINQMVRDLTKHLKSTEVESRMLKIPKPTDTYGNVEIVTLMMKKFLGQEIEKEIREWNIKHCEIDKLTEYLESLFQRHLEEIGNEILIPNHLINKDTLISSWNENMRRDCKNEDSQIISKVEKMFIISTVTLLFPVVALASLLATPLIINHIFKETKKIQNQIKEYEKDKDEYLNNLIKTTLKNMNEEDVRRSFFKSIYEKCEDRVKKFEEFIRVELDEKRKTVETINAKQKEFPERLNGLNKLLVEIATIYGGFLILYQENFPDISLMLPMQYYIPSANNLDNPVPSMDKIIATSDYSTLFINKECDKRNDVIFKVYKQKFHLQYARYQMQEIEFLNKPLPGILKCRNYFKCGPPNSCEQEIVVVYEKKSETTLYDYMIENPSLQILDNKNNPKLLTAIHFVLNIAYKLACALECLHDERPGRMVHPDLRMRTILVANKSERPEDVDIYIYDACTTITKPRHKNSVNNKKQSTPENSLDMGGFTKANIYSYGMLLYNLAYFQKDEMDCENEEIHSIDWSNINHGWLPNAFNDLIKKCLSNSPDHRPDIKICASIIKQIQLDM